MEANSRIEVQRISHSQWSNLTAPIRDAQILLGLLQLSAVSWQHDVVITEPSILASEALGKKEL